VSICQITPHTKLQSSSTGMHWVIVLYARSVVPNIRLELANAINTGSPVTRVIILTVAKLDQHTPYFTPTG
jgi:hypothetical protein